MLELPSALLSIAEIIAYRKFKPQANHPLYEKGFVYLQTDFNQVCSLVPEKEHVRNPYCKVFIYDQKNVTKLAQMIIDNSEIRRNLQEAYGMRYSVDFVYSSQINSIPYTEKDKPFYANEYHRDMLFSSSVVKLFIALEDIDDDQGPTEWVAKEESSMIDDLHIPRRNIAPYISNPYKFTAKKGSSCLLNPHTNIHKAGIPKLGRSRKQLMVQLNPYKDWAVNKNLYVRQFHRETNLPLLRNMWLRDV